MPYPGYRIIHSNTPATVEDNAFGDILIIATRSQHLQYSAKDYEASVVHDHHELYELFGDLDWSVIRAVQEIKAIAPGAVVSVMPVPRTAIAIPDLPQYAPHIVLCPELAGEYHLYLPSVRAIAYEVVRNCGGLFFDNCPAELSQPGAAVQYLENRLFNDQPYPNDHWTYALWYGWAGDVPLCAVAAAWAIALNQGTRDIYPAAGDRAVVDGMNKIYEVTDQAEGDGLLRSRVNFAIARHHGSVLWGNSTAQPLMSLTNAFSLQMFRRMIVKVAEPLLFKPKNGDISFQIISAVTTAAATAKDRRIIEAYRVVAEGDRLLVRTRPIDSVDFVDFHV